MSDTVHVCLKKVYISEQFYCLRTWLLYRFHLSRLIFRMWLRYLWTSWHEPWQKSDHDMKHIYLDFWTFRSNDVHVIISNNYYNNLIPGYYYVLTVMFSGPFFFPLANIKCECVCVSYSPCRGPGKPFLQRGNWSTDPAHSLLTWAHKQIYSSVDEAKLQSQGV